MTAPGARQFAKRGLPVDVKKFVGADDEVLRLAADLLLAFAVRAKHLTPDQREQAALRFVQIVRLANDDGRSAAHCVGEFLRRAAA